MEESEKGILERNHDYAEILREVSSMKTKQSQLNSKLMTMKRSVVHSVLNYQLNQYNSTTTCNNIYDLQQVQSILDYTPLSLSAIKTIGTDFRNWIALGSPPRSIIRHPRLSAEICLILMVGIIESCL